MTCHEHRFMLAIEDSMCEDYVTEKLMSAVSCGAVPIVASYRGVPNYDELFGPFPRIELRLRWQAPQPEPPLSSACCPWLNPSRTLLEILVPTRACLGCNRDTSPDPCPQPNPP